MDGYHRKKANIATTKKRNLSIKNLMFIKKYFFITSCWYISKYAIVNKKQTSICTICIIYFHTSNQQKLPPYFLVRKKHLSS